MMIDDTSTYVLRTTTTQTRKEWTRPPFLTVYGVHGDLAAYFSVFINIYSAKFTAIQIEIRNQEEEEESTKKKYEHRRSTDSDSAECSVH